MVSPILVSPSRCLAPPSPKPRPIPGSFYGRRKSPFSVVKYSKILDIFKYSMFKNFHGHFVSTEDVPTFKIHATLATSIFIADQCDHHFPIHFPIQSSYFPHIMDIFPIFSLSTCPVCFPDFSHPRLGSVGFYSLSVRRPWREINCFFGGESTGNPGFFP